MKAFLNILLFSALVPATFMFGLTFVAFAAAIQNAELSFQFFMLMLSMLLGILGYFGLVLLIFGIHKTNHIKKIIFLSSGLIGFNVFIMSATDRNIVNWLGSLDLETIPPKLTLLVSLIFLVLTVVDFVKKKTVAYKD